MDILSGKIKDINNQDGFLSSRDIDTLESLFQVHPQDYKFANNSI